MKNNKYLVMAKMDAILNDIDELLIHSFPTIVFYPGNAKIKNLLKWKEEKIILKLLKNLLLQMCII